MYTLPSIRFLVTSIIVLSASQLIFAQDFQKSFIVCVIDPIIKNKKDTIKRMKALKHMASRGSVRRMVEIDERSTAWKVKSGREDGPETCECLR